jgi:protein-S-isoprenylcysteine O-methyltransferase Ste14
MKSTYFLFLTLFIISLAIRTGYELFKKAGKANPESKLLFIIILVTMIILWMSWFEMCPLDPLKLILSPWLVYFGFGLFILGWVLALAALFQLRGVENIDHLVTTGLFSLIRHPIYTGFIL